MGSKSARVIDWVLVYFGHFSAVFIIGRQSKNGKKINNDGLERISKEWPVVSRAASLAFVSRVWVRPL
jgi:hypothetical protein